MADDKSKIPASRVIADTTPVVGSGNLITSGAVATAVKQIKEDAKTDSEGNDIASTYAKLTDIISFEEM